jgi:hypothetical protein
VFSESKENDMIHYGYDRNGTYADGDEGGSGGTPSPKPTPTPTPRPTREVKEGG